MPQSPDRVIDAYRFPRYIAPGCQHQLGCKCDVPFWLRPPSPAEKKRFVEYRDDGTKTPA